MDQYENMNFDDVLASGEVDPDEIALLEAEEDPYGNTGVVPKTEEEINDYMYRKPAWIAPAWTSGIRCSTGIWPALTH